MSVEAQAIMADVLITCEETGGQWDGCGSGCGPLTCAQPTLPPGTPCDEFCYPQCACPADAPLWDDMMGCIAEADCSGQTGHVGPPLSELCLDTGGTYSYCGPGCGPMGCDDDPADFEECPDADVPQCICPTDAPLWDDVMGCLAQSDCPSSGSSGGAGDGQSADPAPPFEQECEKDGGIWTDCGSGCGPMGCGDDPADFEMCDDVCLAQCLCPAEAPLWEAGKGGCIPEAECYPSTLPPEVQLCDQTGGEWTDCGSGCGPVTCDNPPDPNQECDGACVALCACPQYAPYWDEDKGCHSGASCDGLALCDETGGTWISCGSGCGPVTCETPSHEGMPCPSICVELCACPDDAPLWDDTVGCIAETECADAPVDDEALCATSGGAWTDCVGGCGPYACDHLPSDDEVCGNVCVEGCQCPEDAPLWDAEAGCIAESECSGSGSGSGSDGDS
ncbi:MAG: hypothetical protein QF464_18775, partial [Myxococcota bacterium]|nr:hypothetical protein [Myxococcota bacterium]